mmetsp:Transcript_127512/g.291418  ORF Transcript_127512/g.291418 Transcript_127512/m.291418 type:complete len:372 (+) Transcript_127512:634-1749(+)
MFVTWACPGQPNIDGLCSWLQSAGIADPRGGGFRDAGDLDTYLELDCTQSAVAPVIKELVVDIRTPFQRAAQFVAGVTRGGTKIQEFRARRTTPVDEAEPSGEIDALLSWCGQSGSLPQLLQMCPLVASVYLESLPPGKELATAQAVTQLTALQRLQISVDSAGLQELVTARRRGSLCHLRFLHLSFCEVRDPTGLDLAGLDEVILEDALLSGLIQVVQTGKSLTRLTVRRPFVAAAEPVTSCEELRRLISQSQTVYHPRTPPRLSDSSDPAVPFGGSGRAHAGTETAQLGWVATECSEGDARRPVGDLFNAVAGLPKLKFFAFESSPRCVTSGALDLLEQNELQRVARWRTEAIEGGVTWTRVSRRFPSA